MGSCEDQFSGARKEPLSVLLSITLYFILSRQVSHWVWNYAGSQQVSDPISFASPPSVLDLPESTATPSLFLDNEDLNLDPRVCSASILEFTEPMS